MKKLFAALFMSIVALGMMVTDAEAKRLGGGRSVGMQRQAVPPKPAQPAQAAPAQPGQAAGAPAAAPKRNWLGPIAGLAAGLGIAALLSHFGMGEGMANILMIALLAFAAFFIFRLIFRRKAAPEPDSAMQYAATQPAAGSTVAAFPPAAGSATGGNIPAGFDSEGFLRVAKLNFVRLQAANDAKNLEDIREFVSPELFAEIKMQMDERGSATQRTDVVTLNADLLEVVTEDNRHIASVQFSGMLREEEGAAAAPFDEVWVLTKPTDDSRGWFIAGIQQTQ